MRKLLSLLAVLVLFAYTASAQTRAVSGQIKDEKGEGVSGATVTEVGTKNAVKADINGFFTIKIKEGSELSFTAVGFNTRVVTPTVGFQTVALTTKNEELKEVVVVSAIGIKRRPKEIGYGTATVKNDEITNGKSPQLAQALSGKVSGLSIGNVNNSVDPQVRVVLRGNRSILGNNQALIVLDGVPVPSNTLSYINPNDIAEVTILKGGQAATLYGSDGVNGAVVITTKRGGKTKPTIQLTSTVNAEQLSFLPKFQTTYGQGSNYGGLDPTGNYRTFENQQYGDKYDGSMRPLGRTLEDGSTFVVPYANIPGERARIWDTGLSNINDISISGGDQTSRFYMSFQNAVTTGIVPKDRSGRTGARLSATKEFGKFTASFVANYVQDRFDRTTTNFYFNAINVASNIPLSQLKDWQNNKFANPNGYFNDYYENPFFNLDNNRQNYGNSYFNGNLELAYRATNWLTVTERLGVANTNSFYKSWTGKFEFTDWAKHSAFVPAPFPNDYNGIARATDIAGGVFDQSSYGNRLNNDFFVTGVKDFGKFNVKATVGSNIQIRRAKTVNISSGSVVIPETYNVANRTGELGGGESVSLLKKYGYYGDLTVGYNDYLYLHASGRLDGSSLFYKEGREKSLYQYPYYGADISLVLSEAIPSLQNNVLSYLKVRAAANKNGNDNLDPYSLDLTYNLGGGFPYGSLAGATVGDRYPDANLKPEFVTSYEAGAEIGFLKNRIYLDVTAFKQISKGQIIPITISRTTGFSQALINAGRVDNWGYEADLRVTPIKSSTMNWDISVKYSYNDNKVVEIYKGLQNVNLATIGTIAFSRAEVGKPFPYISGTSYQRDPATGRVIVNSDGYPLQGPIAGFGGSRPKHQLGVGTTFKYKNFTFSANAEYRGGYVVFHNIGRDMTFTGSAYVTTLYDRTNFVFPNSAYDDGTGKFVPNTDLATKNGFYTVWVDYYRNIAENYITSGAFWKLRDVSISYNLPQSLLNKTKFIKGVTISAIGRNLITLLPKNNWYTDPEFSFTTGNGQGLNTIDQTPPTRQYGGSINITF